MLLTRSDYAQPLGLAGLYLFAFSGALNQGGVYAGMALMLLGALLRWDDVWTDVRRQPALVLSLGLTLYILAQGVMTYLNVDTPGGKLARHVWDLVAIAGLFSLLIAWWLAGDPARIARVLQLALLGVFLGVIKGVDWTHFSAYITQRPLFGMGNGAGLYALIVITGLLTLRSTRLFEDSWFRRRLPALTRKLIVLLLLLFFAAVVLLSQTRAVWLAALLVTPVVVGLLLRSAAKEPPRRGIAGFEASMLGLIVLGLILGFGTIEKRLDADQSALSQILSGESALLPASSVGQRIYLWRDAMQRIEAKPLLGWGAGSAPALIRAAEIPGGLRHYHNLYLQLAVELGVVGLGAFLLWFGLLARTALADCAGEPLGPGYRRFLLAALAIFLVVSFFQIRHDDERGQSLLLLLGALALTCRLRFATRKARKD